MLLTIGMIVKDEERYLESCLEALKPILEKVDSELIIVDTGSTDSTVDIAKKYTDKVFHFEWCDDFSAARNAAMKRAKGSWYMSIDADEIIVDAGNLIDFFNTGEYKKYNAASFVIRSYNKADMTGGADFNAIRLVKIRKDSYYVNPVHERFERVYEPVKLLRMTADHYGYVTENNQEYVEFKMRRNLKLMLSELEKKPKSGLLYLYICQTFRILEENEKALEYISKGIEITQEKNDPVIYSLYSNKAGIFFQMGKYRQALEVAEEYFSSKDMEIGTDLEFHFIKATSCMHLEMHYEAAEAYKEYIRFYNEYNSGQYRTTDTYHHSVSFIGFASYKAAIMNYSKALIILERYLEAEEALHIISSEDQLKGSINDIVNWIKAEFIIMEKTGDFSNIISMYDILSESHEELICDFIEKEIIVQTYRDLILKQFEALEDRESDYISLMKIRSRYYSGELSHDELKCFLEGLGTITPCYADAAYFAAKMGVPVQTVSSKLEPADIEICFYRNKYFHFDDYVALIQKNLKNDITSQDIYTLYWLSSLLYLEITIGKYSDDSITEVLETFSEVIYSYMKAVFKAELLCAENIGLLPRQFAIGYYCHEALLAREEGREVDYIKNLRNTLKLDKRMSGAIGVLTDLFKKKREEAAKINSEFNTYAAQVKTAIKTLIGSGHMDKAAEFLKTYESLCPNDEEVPGLKKLINVR